MSVFVWTLKDALGVVFLALFLLALLVIQLLDWWDKWLIKRKRRKQEKVNRF